VSLATADNAAGANEPPTRTAERCPENHFPETVSGVLPVRRLVSGRLRGIDSPDDFRSLFFGPMVHPDSVGRTLSALSLMSLQPILD
jgi:hypothetical protein